MLLRLLGAVDVADGDGWQRAGPAKQACVLAALALAESAPLHTGELISRMWDGDPPVSAPNVLYSHMTRLRAMLNPIDGIELARDPNEGYRLLIANDEVDVFLMRRAVQRAQEATADNDLERATDLWEQAAGLWRGPALSGIDGGWAASVRKSLHKEQLTVLTGRYGTALMRGDHDRIVDELARVTHAHPTAEALTGQLMLALYRCGRPAEAVDCYDETRNHLRNVFGVDPSPALQDLHRKILRQDRQLDWDRPPEDRPPVIAAGSAAGRAPSVLAIPRQLPADTSVFTGRDVALARIREASESDRRILAVDGHAGVGKTALVVHAAHLLAARFDDGQLYFDLHGWDSTPAVSASEALDRALRALGLPPDRTPPHYEDKAALYREQLVGKKMLIILDNVAELDQAHPLLPAEPGCFVIMTSRRRLTGLVEAEPLSLDPLPRDEATSLFGKITGINPADPRVADITDALDRLPLAIRVAAARLRSRPHWTLEDLVTRLPEGGRLRLLDRGTRSVSTAFDASVTSLPESLRAVLHHLVPLDDIAPEALAEAAGMSVPDAEDLLEELCDEHLLYGLPGGRYGMGALTREYIAALSRS